MTSVATRIPASPQENLLFAFDEFCEGDGMGAAVARIRGMLEESPLRQALSALQQRHPKLRARMVTESDGRRVYDLPADPPAIPFEIKDSDADPLPWQAEAFQLLRRRMDIAAGPMGRLLVLRSRAAGACEVIFASHHAIADAASALRIMDDLLAFYADAAANTLKPVPSLPLVTVSAANSQAKFRHKALSLLALARDRVAKRRGRWLDLPAPAAPESDPMVERYLWTEEETADLARRCQAGRTTIGGALFAAGVCGVAAAATQDRFALRCRIPVNLRHAMTGSAGPVTGQDLGCFISRFERNYRVAKPVDFWAHARLIWRDMETFVVNGGPPLFYNIAGKIRIRRMPKLPKRDTLMINYFGTAKMRGDYGPLHLENIITVVRGDRFGPALNLWAVTVGRRLCVWAGAAGVTREVFSRFQSEALARLRAEAARA